MDRSVKDDDKESFFHFSSSSSSPALTYLGTHTDHNAASKQQSQGFDSSARDVLSGYDLHSSTQPRRRTFPVDHVSSRRHRSAGSPVYLTGELFSGRKDVKMDSHSSNIVTAVDQTIKHYAEKILQVLEGMNGRLSHLESVTQVLENSVASLKVSVEGYYNEADARLKALNNHVTEMHRAVQILRDKQDISETAAELAKLNSSKAEEVSERAMKQPVVSSQIVMQEPLTLVSSLVPERSSTKLQISSQQSNEISGQLQQLSLSADVNALPQQVVPVQVCTLQPIQLSHVLSESESCSTVQAQEILQSMPRVFQGASQYMQTQQFAQPQQGVFQTQSQQGQVQHSFPSQQGVFQAQQQQVQTQQNPQSQQGSYQAQPQHVQTEQIVQSQQGLFQTQQQKLHFQQNAQCQEGVPQPQQQHVLTQPTLSFQQGAYQTQAHHVQPQQGSQVPQEVFQTQPQDVQIQQSAQSQRGAFQSQQQHSQTLQNVQSERVLIQAQSQQVQTQQSIQTHQGPQPQPSQGPMQQVTQPSPQTVNVTSHSEQVQLQVASQQLNFQHSSGGQPSTLHVPSTQFGSRLQPSSPQRLSQVQPSSNFQLQNPPSQAMGGQVIVQPPHIQLNSNVHIPLPGVPGPFQFVQQNESFSHTPVSQATVMQSSSSQFVHNAGPPYNSQQHPFSSQQMLLAQHSNPYHRIPSPLQGPQPVYGSQTARPVISSTHALPISQNVYNQSLSGRSPSLLPGDDEIVKKVTAMGFSRGEAWSAIKRLKDQGQIVDMNLVLDLLMTEKNRSQIG